MGERESRTCCSFIDRLPMVTSADVEACTWGIHGDTLLLCLSLFFFVFLITFYYVYLFFLCLFKNFILIVLEEKCFILVHCDVCRDPGAECEGVRRGEQRAWYKGLCHHDNSRGESEAQKMEESGHAQTLQEKDGVGACANTVQVSVRKEAAERSQWMGIEVGRSISTVFSDHNGPGLLCKVLLEVLFLYSQTQQYFI